MPTLPESPESNATTESPAESPAPGFTPPSADALRARLRAMAAAEQSRREPEPVAPAPPVATPTPTQPLVAEAKTGPSDLWEPARARPEDDEPISSFLVPAPADEKPRPFMLPKAVAVSLPPAPVTPEPERISLEAHVENILTLLRHNEVDEAISQQDTPTHDAPSPLIRTRWQLTRELVSVAKSLPPRVVNPIATAIGRDNLESAKGELVEFRNASAKAARDADVVIRTRAKTIQRGIAGALYVEPVVYMPPQSYTPPSIAPDRSSGANWLWIIAVVVIAIIRVGLRTSNHSSYDYSYTPSSSYYNDSTLRDYEAQLALAEALAKSRVQEESDPTLGITYKPTLEDEPEKLRKDATTDELVEEIDGSLYTLRESDWITDDQRSALSNLWILSPYTEDCTEARSAMYTFEKEPALKGEGMKIAGRHIKAVRQRIDRVCPKKKKTTAKKAAAPTQMELTDTPPVVEAN